MDIDPQDTSALVGEDPLRPGIVHRLDRLVSGVVVLAKTQQAFESLKEQFAKRTVQKEYRAVVHGVPGKQTDIIRFVIARSTTHKGKMAARPENAEGKEAWTEYTLLRNDAHGHYAELEVRIKTGRTHQIRAHMAAAGHPVVGDKLYATKQYKKADRRGKHERLFLHSARLRFTHPVSGQQMEFEAPIPQEFSKFFN